MVKIDALINETPAITDLQKTFYKTMLTVRKERILDKSMELLREKERNQD